MFRSRLVAALIASLIFFSPESPVLAVANEGDFGETHLNINNDWVVYIDVERKKQLFNNPGSKLKPMTNIRVSYRKTTRSAQEGEETTPKIYEDLWYHNGRAMGSHRFRKLGIDRSKRGAIYVRTTDDATLEPRAVANAIVRLTIELMVKDSILTAVVVPRDMFREVMTELAHFGFVVEAEGTVTTGVQTNLFLTSNPKGEDAYLYYRKKR